MAAKCPTCGKELANEFGVKQHHVAAHGESLARVVVECEYCGSDVEKYKSKLEGKQNLFCSEKCKGDWESENVVGENHHQYNKITVECDHCSKDIERTPSKVERNQNNFCSSDCRGSWLSENVSGEDHHQAKRISMECSNCGNSLSVVESQSTYDKKFCNTECMTEWYRNNTPTGEDHWNYEGGEVVYGAGWNERKREKVRERDNRECQDCGIGEESHQQKYNRRLCVHHIIPARQFEDDENRNAMENLISLCSVCHQTWEKMAPLRPQ